MKVKRYEEINQILERTGKAIISIGDSFPAGQGALDVEIYKEGFVNTTKNGIPVSYCGNSSEAISFAEKYGLSYVINSQGETEVRFDDMEHKNAFGEVLTKKYLNDEYANINLSNGGKGNASSVNDLLLHPRIHWEKLKKAIVVYVPSGLDRWDIISDSFDEWQHFNTVWPFGAGGSGAHGLVVNSGRWHLSNGYERSFWTEKFLALNQILIMNQLQLWCKAYNAELIVTPGFCKDYNRDYFKNALSIPVLRDRNLEMVDTDNGVEPGSAQYLKLTGSRTGGRLDSIRRSIAGGVEPTGPGHPSDLLDTWPWDKMFQPENCKTFIGLAMKQEGLDPHNANMWDFIGKGSKNYYVTPCSHPGQPAHELFAKRLFEHLTEKNVI